MEKKEIRVVNLLNNQSLPFVKVAAIYMSNDYSQFETFKTNRLPDHVARIKANIIDKGYITNPLLVTLNPVNNKCIIIDGNNRYHALKELGLPIHFVMLDGATEADMIALNLVSKNWTKKNYISFYASKGYEDYVQFLAFAEEYPEFDFSTLEHVLKLSCEQDHSLSHSKGGHHKLQRGLFKVKDANKSREILDFCMKVKSIPVHSKMDTVYNQSRFVLAVMRLFRSCDTFEPEEALSAMMKERGMITRKNTLVEYAKMIEDMVNKHIRNKNNRKHFDF